MPLIPRFRIDGDRPERDQLEFFFKINNESNHKLLNLRVSGDGLYYYRPGSQILSPKENRKTRKTYDGYLPMETVRKMFESLSKAGWTRRAEENSEVEVRVVRRKGRENEVILRVVKGGAT